MGLRSQQFRLPDNIGESELLKLIEELNADESIDGILVQLPLPRQIDRWRMLEAINAAKDVDGFHPYNVGRLATGRPALAPCTPLGVVHLIKTIVTDLKGPDVIVIGRSNIVGNLWPFCSAIPGAPSQVRSSRLETSQTSVDKPILSSLPLAVQS